ncbi:MAG TPA: glycosyltransferase family 4 protein, partial [Thermoanaerobaculia bacterium]|nr:glycosyltransferase family 4 protein [Thermoanaerobaculia bacterium]
AGAGARGTPRRRLTGAGVRVLLVANTLPPRDLSGVGEQVLQLAAGLRDAGHEVEVLGRGPGGGAAGSKLLFPLAVLPAAWRALRRFRPDVVQVHESDGALVALLVAAASRLLDPPPRLAALLQVSYREERRAVRPLRGPEGRVLGKPGGREKVFKWGKAPLQAALGKLTVACADVVLAPSAATAAELARDYGAERVRVVPNAMGRLETAREELEGESAGAAGHLLFVGRLRVRKGVEVLLAAVARLRTLYPETAVVIAGEGEHRRALEETARRLGLREAVTFLGRCDAARVRALLAGARALAVPSIYEGMPLVVLEAMDAGVPVVASAVSGIPEVVRDGETGWLVPPEDPEALAAALAEVYAAPEEARRRGEAGRRRLDERFRPRHAAAAWLTAVKGEP